MVQSLSNGGTENGPLQLMDGLLTVFGLKMYNPAKDWILFNKFIYKP